MGRREKKGMGKGGGKRKGRGKGRGERKEWGKGREGKEEGEASCQTIPHRMPMFAC